MSAFKGTGGNWHASTELSLVGIDRSLIAVAKQPVVGRFLAVVTDGQPVMTLEQAEANARLIAASPRLLRALDMAETSLALEDKTCAEFPEGDKRCWECLGCMRQATQTEVRDAIAAALGEQS